MWVSYPNPRYSLLTGINYIRFLMTDLYIKHISFLLGINQWQALHCVELLEEGATIPFISRYRKERTGGLDEVQVGQIKHYYQYFKDLDSRKAAILASIQQQGALTCALP